DLLLAITSLTEAELQRDLLALTEAELLFQCGLPPKADYQFKHALIRDAAYEALLKSRRRELHRVVARTIDEQFPIIKESHPEVLARHWTEAGEHKYALSAWQKAGEVAATRGASVEAAGQYTLALQLLYELPESMARDRQELELQVGLGRALWGAKS